MAHAQKPDFVFPRNGRVHSNRWGCQFSRPLAAEVCASAWVMLDRPRSEVAWEYWLPTPFASFPFTSHPVRHRVPPGSERALLQRGVIIVPERVSSLGGLHQTRSLHLPGVYESFFPTVHLPLFHRPHTRTYFSMCNDTVVLKYQNFLLENLPSVLPYKLDSSTVFLLWLGTSVMVLGFMKYNGQNLFIWGTWALLFCYTKSRKETCINCGAFGNTNICYFGYLHSYLV